MCFVFRLIALANVLKKFLTPKKKPFLSWVLGSDLLLYNRPLAAGVT